MPGLESDPRIKRTRAAFVAAYLEARSKRAPEAESVAGLCRVAGMSRSVFYRHFEGLEDLEARGLGIFLVGLLEEAGLAEEPEPAPMEAGGGAGLDGATGLSGAAESRGAPPEAGSRDSAVRARVVRFFTALERHRPVILPLLRRSPRLTEDLRSAAEEWLEKRRLELLPESAFRAPRRYAAPLLAASLIAVTATWLEDPRGEGPEEAAKIFLDYATKGLFDFGA